MGRSKKDVDMLVLEALSIEADAAREAGVSGYMARVLTQAAIPHSRVKETYFQRSNGVVAVTLSDVAGIGLPFGSYPRLLLAWITSEAVKTRDPLLEFGPTLSGFMAELGLLPTGGRWGTIQRLREQMARLFSCAISCHYTDEHVEQGAQLLVAREYNLWWNPKKPDQAALWGSTVRLSSDFFKELVDHPALVSMRALRELKQSPMSLDIYCYLVYRYSYLTKKTSIPWEALQSQFGAGYPVTVDGLRDFKKRFRQALERIRPVYPNARFEIERAGITLLPSRTPAKQLGLNL